MKAIMEKENTVITELSIDNVISLTEKRIDSIKRFKEAVENQIDLDIYEYDNKPFWYKVCSTRPNKNTCIFNGYSRDYIWCTASLNNCESFLNTLLLAKKAGATNITLSSDDLFNLKEYEG